MKTKYLLIPLFFIFIGLIAACNGGDPYDNFIHFDHYDELETYDETGELYLVYVYLEECPACQELLDDLVEFHNDYGDEYPILADEAEAEGTRPGQVSAVPTMFLMRDGEVVEGPVKGVQPIVDLLDDIVNGVYN